MADGYYLTEALLRRIRRVCDRVERVGPGAGGQGRGPRSHPQPVWAEILAANAGDGSHTWQQVRPTGRDTWETLPDGLTSEASGILAWATDGSLAEAGDVVQLFLAMDSDGEPQWRFHRYLAEAGEPGETITPFCRHYAGQLGDTALVIAVPDVRFSFIEIWAWVRKCEGEDHPLDPSGLSGWPGDGIEIVSPTEPDGDWVQITHYHDVAVYLDRRITSQATLELQARNVYGFCEAIIAGFVRIIRHGSPEEAPKIGNGW